MTKRRRPEFELFFLLALVALAAAWYARTHLRGEQPLPNLSWEEHFQRAGVALDQGNLSQAERELLRARSLAVEFEVGDDRLAQTLERMGETYFRADDYAQARAVRGDAVAALLLARGPYDSRVESWIDRYLWAKSRTEDGISFFQRDPATRPHQFVVDYRPLTSPGRHGQELQNLRTAYKYAENGRAVRALDGIGGGV